MSNEKAPLFEPYTLGSLTLKNRVVMAPMTRCRALDNVPNERMATYYSDRASGGLLITEGTAPSPNGLGYARIPGMFSQEQIEGWRLVTDAVHQAGGAIFIQLMHVGRVGHPLNMPDGAELVSASAIKAQGEMHTDKEGPKPQPTPRKMAQEDIESTIQEYVDASIKAIEAGFDGVELHGANGYLIDQFINPKSNQRDDDWGGSIEARNRFALEVARRCVDAIGAQRVGMRISPHGVFNDLAPFAHEEAQYVALAKGLSDLGLVYLHVVDHEAMGAPEVPQEIKRQLRDAFDGTYILSGGYTDAAQANADITESKGDLVAFGRPFLANPDLVARLKGDAPLNDPDPSTFYTPGDAGYNDYSTL